MLVLAQSFSKYSKFLSAKLPMKFLYLQNSYLISYKNDSKLCIIDSFRKRELTDSLEVSLRLCLQSELPSVDCCWCRNLEKKQKSFLKKNFGQNISLFSSLHCQGYEKCQSYFFLHSFSPQKVIHQFVINLEPKKCLFLFSIMHWIWSSQNIIGIKLKTKNF